MSELESPRLRALQSELDAGASSDAFWQERARSGTTLIEPLDAAHDLVTFLFRGAPSTRRVTIEWPAWTYEFAKSGLARLAGSDVWWKSVRMPHDTRMSFRYVVDPKPSQPAGEPGSQLVLPGAPPEPFLTAVPPGAAGSMEAQVWLSRRLANQHPLVVYRPVGYDARQPYPLLIVFDGETYLDKIAAPRLLDNLIAAHKIVPVVAVFVLNATPSSRSHELPCSAAFADALTSELLPFLRSHYALTSDAARVALAGASYGGLAAAFIAHRHPESYGLALCQSGSFWWNFPRSSRHYDGSDAPGWLTRRFAEHDKLPIRFFLTAGAFERAAPGNGNLETTRALRDTLRAKGYAVDYRDFSGGHDPLAWRATFPEGLISLFGPPP